jgi:hypothetical protein
MASDDIVFAELDIIEDIKNIISSAQPIVRGGFDRADDTLLRRFNEMRSFTERGDEALFYRQAKFMEDFTDDYGGNAGFSRHFPSYRHMAYEQLRTYFTWRAKARGGELLPTSHSYVLLYIYELLSGIGVSDARDGLDRLNRVRNSRVGFDSSIDKQTRLWIRDYCVCYGLEYDFPANGTLAKWNGQSSYDIMKSKFYLDGNQALTAACFEAVIGAAREALRGTLSERFLFGVAGKYIWRPFEGSLARCPKELPDRRAELGGDVYELKDGRWTVTTEGFDPRKRELVGYLIKKTEIYLRQAVKYKHSLTADPARAMNSMYNMSPRPMKEYRAFVNALDGIAESAVRAFYADLTRTVVSVDTRSLARIREEALGTQERLTVEDDAPQTPAVSLMTDPPPQASGRDGFKNALTDTEIKALSIILSNGDIKRFAAENGIMAEVLADGINEKAADHLGDAVLDGEMAVYREYFDTVKSLCS